MVEGPSFIPVSRLITRIIFRGVRLSMTHCSLGASAGNNCRMVLLFLIDQFPESVLPLTCIRLKVDVVSVVGEGSVRVNLY